MFFSQLILDYELHLLIAAAVLCLIGTVLLVISHRPYYSEVPEEFYMPVKIIWGLFRFGILLSLLGFLLIALVILAHVIGHNL
ncbi:MAG: hypothetical protein PVG99_02440 [Desulfobacteraceae bacterium]|jgi:hypothetical protein